jgi:hypothetical protein
MYVEATATTAAAIECTVPGFDLSDLSEALYVQVSLNMQNYNARDEDARFQLYAVRGSPSVARAGSNTQNPAGVRYTVPDNRQSPVQDNWVRKGGGQGTERVG